MAEKRVSFIARNGLFVFIVSFMAAVDIILAAYGAAYDVITVVDLIIALGFALLYLDERIQKLERANAGRILKFNKKGVTRLIAFVLVLLVILLLWYVLNNQPGSSLLP